MEFPRLLEIAARISKLLGERKETVAVSESSCGGLVSAALMAVPGSSSYYKGANVAYSRDGQKLFFPPTLMEQECQGQGQGSLQGQPQD